MSKRWNAFSRSLIKAVLKGRGLHPNFRSDCRDGCGSWRLKKPILVEKLDFLAKILGWAPGISVETSRWWASRVRPGLCWGALLIECGLERARACFESQLKNFDFWGTIGENQKSCQQTTVYWKIATEFQPHCWRSNFLAIDSARGPGAISQSWEHTPIKNGLCVFPGYCFKND